LNKYLYLLPLVEIEFQTGTTNGNFLSILAKKGTDTAYCLCVIEREKFGEVCRFAAGKGI
jgi:hypothetical protein